MPLTKDQAMKLLDDHKEKMKKDPASCSNLMCENVKILPNHFPAVSGKAAVAADHKAKAAKFADFEISHTIEEVLNEGDIAIVDGTVVASKGGKEMDSGKFLTIMKKEGDSYKMLRHMHNTSRPHPECGK